MRKFLFCVPLLLLCVFRAAPASAAGTAVQIHAPPAPVRAGEVFTVRLDVEGNPGVSSVQLTLAFDPAEMSCTGVTAGGLLSGAMYQGNPQGKDGAVLSAASAETIEGDGTLAEFSFRAEADVSVFRFDLENAFLWDAGNRTVPFSVTGQETGGSGAETPSPGETPAPDRDAASAPSRASGGSSGRTSTPAPDPAPAPDPVPASDALPPAIPAAEPDAPPDTAAREPDSGGTPPDAGRPAPSFTDTAGHWAEAQIREAAARGLFHGYGDGSFRPDSLLTRAQFVTVLWNLSGRPSAGGETPFRDTAGIHRDFQESIAWAWRNGYVSGTASDAFSPDLPLTRQAAMKILFAYYGGQSGQEVLFTGVYDGQYTDSGSISAWAKPAVYWGVYHDILRGTSSTTLSPGGFATRAQTAVILIRCTDRFPARS